MVLKRFNKEVDPELSKAQRRKPCNVCGVGGRTVGRLGDIELNYCPHHRKYGERVLNFLVRSVFGDELKNFLKESKDDLFMKNKPALCDSCNKKLADYTDSMIGKLDEARKWNAKMEHKTGK